MNYELAKKLKEAGFSQKAKDGDFVYCRGELCFVGAEFAGGVAVDFKGDTCELEEWCIKAPNLSELIEACGEKFGWVGKYEEDEPSVKCWEAVGHNPSIIRLPGSTPSEAVANLWLELNKTPFCNGRNVI